MQNQPRTILDSLAGLIVLDTNRRVVYANAESLRILVYPDQPPTPSAANNWLADRIRPIIRDRISAEWSTSEIDFLSGRRHYTYRFFALKDRSQNSGAPAAAVLIQRVHKRPLLDRSVVEQFGLTSREAEVVAFLCQGLTSKEIAARMEIRPNTVKAFVRLVMTKVGVCTRSGIVGTVLNSQSPQRPSLRIYPQPDPLEKLRLVFPHGALPVKVGAGQRRRRLGAQTKSGTSN